MSMSSLWGDDFVVKSEPLEAKKIVKKISKPKDSSSVVTKAVKSKAVPLADKLAIITENVKKILGRYADNTQVIKTREELTKYIDASIANGVIAVDTETNNSLQPITCKLMGPCLYTPGQKNAYIPINHVNPSTGVRLEWQLTEEDVKEELSRLSDTKIITHNGKFDYQVIKCTTGVEMVVYWDTFVGAKILDENERSAGLKQQYIEKIDPSVEKYSIDHLFEDVEYAVVDPDIFALYAATDSFMTYKLYLWQKEQFEIPDHKRIYDLFMNVEMPIVPVAAEMEMAGIEIDTEYAKLLSAKYHKQLDAIDEKIAEELHKYDEKVARWRLTEEANYHPPKKTGEGVGKSKSEQLENPINMSSPTQLAIFLYDILQTPVIDKKSPRGTGEEILTKIKLDICDLILERRGLLKLIDTYVDKFPEIVLPETGRLHAHFLQLGAGIGRFSSADPNLQNIPSHRKDIRLMFKARDGYTFVGSDFSQQEPRLLSAFSNDDNMINAYKAGKDLYATIAQGVYKNGYWDNMEHFEDGTPNPEGKKRRSNCKSLLLGIMYGRGVASIAEQTGSTFDEAQKIIDDFYTGFPKVKEWTVESQENCKKNGYVEDLWGRRRRLPDIQLPKYTVKDTKDKGNSNFNPILGCLGKVTKEENSAVAKYKMLLENMKGRKQYEQIKSDAYKEGIMVVDNGGFIAQAERQCVNARIQGSAATMSKKAMIKVHNDAELKRLGFQMLLAVHDELIGECPEENADAVADRLCEVMKHAAEPEVTVPFKCDPTIEKWWYWSDYTDNMRKDYKKLIEKGLSASEAKDVLLLDQYAECTVERMESILSNM